MKILLCHNFYRHPGGEDNVFASEGSLLESRGHTVLRFTRRNDEIAGKSQTTLAARTLWNAACASDLRKLIRHARPDLMHCTNTFPLMSPAIYDVARQEQVAVVQSLHNYRTICPKAQLVRDGKICESCVGKAVPWPALVHKCYRDSRAATAVVVAMSAFHRARRTWHTKVDCFITPSEFARTKLIAGGLPADRIFVKPNFVHPDPGSGLGGEPYAVYVGRLSPEKGVQTLLDAWSHVRQDVTLKILGDGPLAEAVRRAAETDKRIQWLGQCGSDQVNATIGDAQCLLMPSVCYETFGLAIIEAFAKGTPVIASRLGAMEELVGDGESGLLVDPNNPRELANKIEQLMGDCQLQSRMRRAARREYESKYTAEANYHQLMSIYQLAMADTEAQLEARLPGVQTS